MQTAQNSNPNITTNEIIEQYEELRTVVFNTLYGQCDFFVIDATLKDVLFVLSNASKGKKKC